MKPERIKELRELCDAAPSGLYKAPSGLYNEKKDYEDDEDDIGYFAAYHYAFEGMNAIPELLDYIKALENVAKAAEELAVSCETERELRKIEGSHPHILAVREALQKLKGEE